MVNSYPLYISAILIPVLSCFAILLDVPPMIWHIRNRNIAASALIFWLIVLNIINFCNALIWPRDNILEWWNGSIFCDIQVRLVVGAAIGGLPGATLCITKALARVLDTKRTISGYAVEHRKCQYIMDGLVCFGLPAFFVISMYIVQGGRYFISGISGCDVPIDQSWPSVVILFIWPPIILLSSSYYAGKCLSAMIMDELTESPLNRSSGLPPLPL
jgi:pheromone a factor receptor